MTGLFNELKRRNVFRVAVTYLVAAWVIAQVSGLAADAFEAPAWIMQMIITILVIGFFPAVIFAWIFELSPDRLKRERDLVDKETVNRYTARKLNIAVLVLLVLAIGLLLADRFLFDTRAPVPTVADVPIEEAWQLDSIAVLPFADFSPDRSQAWLGEGIAETLLHALAQIEGLRVSARTSSFAYRDRDADVATIGRELNVATVLEGSVQRAGDRLRVVAQLVRTDNHDHIFSKTFDRNPDDIFAIQDEIAAAVAQSLMGTAAPEQAELARTGTRVYDLYLEGRQHWQKRTAADVERAVELLQQAVDLDPDYGPARSELATALLFKTYHTDAELDSLRDEIERHLRRALELDPDDAQAWAARGLLFQDLGLQSEALEALHQAESLSPNDANFQIWLANRYQAILDFDRGLAHFQRAFELDPLNPFVRRRYATMLSWMDRNNPAIERVARDTIRLFPDDEENWNSLLNLLANRYQDDELILVGIDAARKFPDSANFSWWITSALYRVGEFEAFELWESRLQSQMPDTFRESAFMLARAKPEEFLEAARRDHERFGKAAVAPMITALNMNERYHEAWELLTSHLSDFEQRVAAGDLEDEDFQLLMTAAWLAGRLEKEGPAAEYRELIETLWNQVRSSQVMTDNVLGQLSVEVALGRQENAIELLSQFPDEMLISLEIMLKHEPMFADLAATPQGQAIIDRSSQRRARMAERIRAEAPPELFNPDLLP
jgi:TolB-like protein/Tfp pilus assembly protein PilF